MSSTDHIYHRAAKLIGQYRNCCVIEAFCDIFMFSLLYCVFNILLVWWNLSWIEFQYVGVTNCLYKCWRFGEPYWKLRKSDAVRQCDMTVRHDARHHEVLSPAHMSVTILDQSDHISYVRYNKILYSNLFQQYNKTSNLQIQFVCKFT